MAEIVLSGLHTEPIAEYLAALGVLRLVAEQVDAQATGCWRGDTFVLDSALDEDGLVEFFANAYRPSPVVGPWNGGSGFYPKDNTDGVNAIAASTSERFADYRVVIGEVRSMLATLGITDKPDKKAKTELIQQLRSGLSDSALEWLDAALVLTNEGERFPPLLGTGGNDGRLEFSNNFMKRIADLLLGNTPPATQLIRGVLFGEPTPGLIKAPVGQFNPAQAGGVNATVGFDAEAQINPWSYVLMVEGALVPSSTATRRLESSKGGSLSYPFVVRSAMVGYASAGPEKSRDEIWLPTWQTAATYREIRHLFAEGRAKVPTRTNKQADSREAVDGLDFARAIASLGVNRGISTFVRFGFQERNGLSFFAVPLGRWVVHRSKGADLLAEIDGWLARVRGFVGSGKAPASVVRANNRVEAAIMDVCRGDDPSRLLDLLTALGELELALGRGRTRLIDRPLPSLSSGWWTSVRDEDSVEFRLAAALASAGMRPRMSPVEPLGKQWWAWAKPNSKVETWVETASLESNLLELLRRRDIEAQQGTARERFLDAKTVGIGQPRVWARLDDIDDFIAGRVDDRRLEALLRGLALIRWPMVPEQRAPRDEGVLPPSAFTLLALAREGTMPGTTQRFPDTPGLLPRAAAGRLADATTLAVQRLHAAGLTFSATKVPGSPTRSRRIAAALAFPLSDTTLELLQARTFPRFRPKREGETDDTNTEDAHDTREDLHP